MSTKRLSHLKEWEKIYIPLERILHLRDDTDWLCFHDVSWCISWMDDEDTFYTLDDLKQLANDGMPKQGEKILVSDFIDTEFKEFTFIWFSYWKAVTEYYHPYDIKKWSYYKLKPKKTELTLAEVEERLGLDAGSLIIKD